MVYAVARANTEALPKDAALKQRVLRKAHRWLGIVAALQLLIWTGSGLFFAVMPIDGIRGAGIVEQSAAFRLKHVRLIPPNQLVRGQPALDNVSIDDVQIRQRLNTPIYLITVDKRWLAFNARTGERLPPLNENEARMIARNNSRSEVRSAVLVTELSPGSEYREGGELPAWRVELEGTEGAALWIGANSGQINAVRTSQWRLYDLLWSLHIMDYRGRDNFNTWLLRGFALLGVITMLSGVWLFFKSLRRRVR